MNIVLQPSKPSNTPYSSQIVQHLLEKETVSAGMVEVGLLAVLRLRNDWVRRSCQTRFLLTLIFVIEIDNPGFNARYGFTGG